MSRIVTCGGHEEHRLGLVYDDHFDVYGVPKERVTKTGRRIWEIPRPRFWPTPGLPPEGHVALPPNEDFWKRQIERGGPFAWVQQRVHPKQPMRITKTIDLPAWVKCWGCGWIGIIKPEGEQVGHTP